MKIKRRDLLKSVGLAGLGIAGCGTSRGTGAGGPDSKSIYSEKSQMGQ